MGTGIGPGWETMPAGVRRRVAGLALARSLFIAAAIVVGYFVLPMTGSLALSGLLVLVGGLTAIAALIAWQIREILRSHYPAVRAIGALVVSVPSFLVVFSTIYYLMESSDPGSWSEPLTRLDALYYTVTVFATVGFGDITALSQGARAVTTLQMIVGLALVGVIARVVVGAVQESRRRREAG
ncbi:MAG TPA: potassium channel family protein [Nocardioidaceae bacterium]